MPERDCLETNIEIAARPSTVFRFFTDTERFQRWMGATSEISAEPGGAVRVSYPGGGAALGEVLELVPMSASFSRGATKTAPTELRQVRRA